MMNELTHCYNGWQIRRHLASVLLVTLFLQFNLAGQTPQTALPQTAEPQAAAPEQTAGPLVERLKIYVLQGANAQHDIEKGRAVQTVVEVRDEAALPVEGAAVIFRLPATGAGGSFGGNSSTYKTITNSQGQASMAGFVPNSQMGAFEVNVTATHGSSMGQAVVKQTNGSLYVRRPEVEERGFWSRWKWPVIGAVAAGAAAGIWLGVRNGSSTSGSRGVIITPGPVVIGGPQ